MSNCIFLAYQVYFMPFKENLYLILFCIASLVSLFFIDRDNDVLELTFKLASIISLLLLYLKKTKKISVWYILILVFSCFYTFFLIYDADFIAYGTFLMVVNRAIYVIIALKLMSVINYKKITIYLLTFLIPVVVIFPQFKSHLEGLSSPILAIGLLSALMCALAFTNYLKKMNTQNKLFLFGLLLLVIADILITINRFIDYKFYFVIIYTSMYYLARYLICNAMINEKN